MNTITDSFIYAESRQPYFKSVAKIAKENGLTRTEVAEVIAAEDLRLAKKRAAAITASVRSKATRAAEVEAAKTC